MSSPSDPTPPPQTAADAINTIRNTLSHLVSPAGIHVIPPKDAHLHSLSPVPLPTARRTLSASLKVLLGSAIARESWDSSSPTTERLRRVKADTVLKRRAIQESKSALSHCRTLAIIQDPFASPVSLAIQRLRAVADTTDAITDENVDSLTEGGDRLLTICGKKFYADFHFSAIPPNSFDVKVKFRKLLSDDSEVGDPNVDSSFAHYIKRKDFDTLKLAFQKLMAFEKLADVVKQVSLIDALRLFEENLLEAYMAERKSGFNDDSCMRLGHGVVRRSALGLSIKYMKGHTAVLGVEDATPSRPIAIEKAQLIMPPPLQTPSIPLVRFSNCKMAAVGAQYVLTFQKPIYVCLSVAQRLERVGLSGDNTPDPGKMRRKEASSTDDASCKDPFWPSLQSLLAPTVFGQHEDEDGNGDVASAKELVKKREHWSQRSAEFIASCRLPDDEYLSFSHSGSEMIPGVAVHRVPLCHPRNVKPIFALVRQQIVFNTLFESCFGKPIYPGHGLSPLQSQPVEVVICDAPSFLQLSLYDASLNDILSMAVNIEFGGEVKVSLKVTTEQRHVCSDEKASAILRISQSIPLTILTILRLGRSAGSIRP